MAGFISLCIISLLCRCDTARTTSHAITFPIPRKLAKISSSFISWKHEHYSSMFIYDKNWCNDSMRCTACNSTSTMSTEFHSVNYTVYYSTVYMNIIRIKPFFNKQRFCLTSVLLSNFILAIVELQFAQHRRAILLKQTPS